MKPLSTVLISLFSFFKALHKLIFPAVQLVLLNEFDEQDIQLQFK